MTIGQIEQVNTMVLLGILKEVFQVGELSAAAEAHKGVGKVFRLNIFPLVLVVQSVGSEIVIRGF